MTSFFAGHIYASRVLLLNPPRLVRAGDLFIVQLRLPLKTRNARVDSSTSRELATSIET